ncbi:kinase-like protein [Hypoxylon trugodes]|uniref:kinase-like protein n=1 Tax=Hypoxylon trugodes TaxID=326681 RepID=UPI00219CEDB7|nr:kinase-like protein [Hypoxylon trugodes]KAI1392172.1 kinase-like protein [Hypoxylon trugodes]
MIISTRHQSNQFRTMAAPQTQVRTLPSAMSSPLPSSASTSPLQALQLQASQPTKVTKVTASAPAKRPTPQQPSSHPPTSTQLLHPSNSHPDAPVSSVTTAEVPADANVNANANGNAEVNASVTRISSSASTTPFGKFHFPFLFSFLFFSKRRKINLTNNSPTDISPSPSTISLNTTTSTTAYYSHNQTPIESLRRYPLDLTSPIPEEGDEETGSESFSNEPITPVSGRQSRDFRYCEQNDTYQSRDSITNGLDASSISGVPEQTDTSLTITTTNKSIVNPSLLLSPTHLPLPSQQLPPPTSHALSPPSPTSITPQAPHESLSTRPTTQSDNRPESSRRPSTPARSIARRASSGLSTLSKTMTMFKRNSYHVGDNSATGEFKDPNYVAGVSETTLNSTNRVTPNSSRRRFSFHRSSTTTRSNTPPSPGSPAELPPNASKEKSNRISIPTSRDFLENHAKKNRANTGFSIRDKMVSFASNRNSMRRTRSLERKKKKPEEEDELTRQPWAIPPDAGTGMKARRLSLSLPDDFTVDVAELMKEFEYQHKFLGRHGKHLGKGATSKVTLMVRKGSPSELYAVKEFRSKSSSETMDDYEKKIKSEYSIAKSLHHPNIVETIRLCTNHGRWNHVMEYCSEGDLFTLVSKKYLRDESRDGDRLCLFKQLCQGINYLHTNGIAHRDIKLENLLITKDSKLKITDFGVSEVFSGIHPGLREAGGQCGIGMGDVRLCKPGICGSLPYIAPEVLSKKSEYDPRALDVWSSAVVMVYLIFNASLWEKAQDGLTTPTQTTYNTLVAAWEKVEAKKEAKPEETKDAYPKVPAFEMFVKPVALRRLLLNMLNPNPAKRITMHDVITNRWMKSVECCQLESYEDPVKFIDASKKDCMKSSTGKIFCHNHLPPLSTGHGLPPMPGKPGY